MDVCGLCKNQIHRASSLHSSPMWAEATHCVMQHTANRKWGPAAEREASTPILRHQRAPTDVWSLQTRPERPGSSSGLWGGGGGGSGESGAEGAEKQNAPCQKWAGLLRQTVLGSAWWGHARQRCAGVRATAPGWSSSPAGRGEFSVFFQQQQQKKNRDSFWIRCICSSWPVMSWLLLWILTAAGIQQVRCSNFIHSFAAFLVRIPVTVWTLISLYWDHANQIASRPWNCRSWEKSWTMILILILVIL